MLDSEFAAPSPLQASESDRDTQGRSSASPASGSSTFSVLSLKEDDGCCLATVICAGFASVLRFGWNRHDDLVLVTGSDEWPEQADKEADSAAWYEVIDLVAAFLNGTQAERCQLNARLAGEYLASKEAA